MRVAFATTVLAKGLAHSSVDGIGSYTRELGSLLARRTDVSLIPVGFRQVVGEDVIDGAEAPETLCGYVKTAAWSAVTPCSFPVDALRSRNVELFHATDHLIPKFSHIPVVATLMDAIPLSNPEWGRMRFAAMKRWLWRRAAQWADHVITISEYSKREIVEQFGITDDKISVTPLGVDQRFFECIEGHIKTDILRKLGLAGSFFLFVGTLQPRKNVERILDAHLALPDAIRKEYPLVIVGRAGWGCESLVKRLTDVSALTNVFWLHYLSDIEVRVLMQAARALVFPSLCEGFGLPVVEAFASGLPVITSNSTSLPEVAGDAALLVTPTNVAEIADAMHQMVHCAGLPERLSEAGRRRALELNWESCAQLTQAAYRRAVAG